MNIIFINYLLFYPLLVFSNDISVNPIFFTNVCKDGGWAIVEIMKSMSEDVWQLNQNNPFVKHICKVTYLIKFLVHLD